MLTVGFKTREEIAADIRIQTRLAVGSLPDIVRWSDAEIEFAVNMVISTWGDHVSIPAAMDVTNTDYGESIVLPWYVNAVEAVYSDSYNSPVRVRSDQSIWDELLLELPSDVKTASVIFPLLNGECMPTELYLTASYDDGDDEMFLSSGQPGGVPEQGVVKAGGVWFPFVRVDDTGLTSTLKILASLPHGMTPSYPIGSGALAEMGVVSTSTVLWAHMNAYAISLLHSMYSSYGSPTDIETHQWFMRWWDTRASELWGRYKPRQIQSKLPLR